MSSTEFVGPNRLSQVLASIKQAGNGTVADGKSIRINDSGQLELTGVLTGITNYGFVVINEYSGVFGINQYGIFKFDEWIFDVTESSVPQPTTIYHLDNKTTYSLEEIKELASHQGGEYLVVGSIYELSFGYDTTVVGYFDLSAMNPLENILTIYDDAADVNNPKTPLYAILEEE